MALALTELERSWPNKVALPIPEGGFGWRFAYLLHAARDCGSRRHWQEGTRWSSPSTTPATARASRIG
jgi:hypothetical protein